VNSDVTSQRFVLGDWGTSRLRLYLLDGELVIDRCDGPGIASLASALPGLRMETLAGLVAPWTDASGPLRIVLCGMAGSRNGLMEVPYAPLPVNAKEWSGASGNLKAGSLRITIAAGVCSNDDVMRGEETQVFGAMHLDPELANRRALLLLPGTHSKWVTLCAGSITGFRTAITGEMYSLLHDHSTLLMAGHTADPSPGSDEERAAGFEAGTASSRTLDGGLTGALFAVRTAQLLDNRSKAWAGGYLSGLLIGHEIASMSEVFGAIPMRIIGDPELATLYQRAFGPSAPDMRILDGTECAMAGLRLLQEIAVYS
jgi:2-dehydro-3-deoxygalactonokinase